MQVKPIDSLKLNSVNGKASVIISLVKNNDIPTLQIEHRDAIQVNTGTAKSFLDDNGEEVKLTTDNNNNLVIVKE